MAEVTQQLTYGWNWLDRIKVMEQLAVKVRTATQRLHHSYPLVLEESCRGYRTADMLLEYAGTAKITEQLIYGWKWLV
jgi:hypothetical protein